MSHPTTTRPITVRGIGERVTPAAAATTIPRPTTIAAIPKTFSPALLMLDQYPTCASESIPGSTRLGGRLAVRRGLPERPAPGVSHAQNSSLILAEVNQEHTVLPGGGRRRCPGGLPVITRSS